MLSHKVEGIRKCEHRVECQHGGGLGAPTTQSVDNVMQCTLMREHLCLCRPLLISTVACLTFMRSIAMFKTITF